MKFKLLLSFIIFQNLTFAQDCTDYVEIPDTIFKEYLINNSAINSDGDTEISCTEANNFTGGLALSEKGISDLKGIEHFTNITFLDCYNNSLTSLDLSNNTALHTLDCSFNGDLGSLNIANGNNENFIFLDVSGTSLSCIQVDNEEYSSDNWRDGNDNLQIDIEISFDNECVTGADYVFIPDSLFKETVLNNPDINTNGDALISFTEASNYTGGLEIPGVSSLTGLEAFTNITLLNCSSSPDITSLDVSNNLALTFLNCSGIDFSGSLDVSNNLALKTLNCSSMVNNRALLSITINEGLEQLSCSVNQSLNKIGGFSENITLKYLDCNNTSIETLDISNKPNLSWLDCSETNVWNLDFSNNNALTTLNVESTLITELDVSNKEFLETLYASIAPGASENRVYLPLGSLNVSGCVSLQSIDHLLGDQLTTLNCSNTGITSLDVTNSTSLNELFCSNNESLISLNITNGNNTNLTLNATNNPNLECIQVDDPDYSSENWSEYVDQTVGFSTDCSISTIICRDYVNIPDTIFKAYLVNNTLINTDGDTEISCTEASSFTGGLALSQQGITDLKGIEYFTNITFLDCYNNSLTSLDLSSNTALVFLDCASNENLESLNIANGNNENFEYLSVTETSLSCIQVDNELYSSENWRNGDENFQIGFEIMFDNECASTISTDYVFIPDSLFKETVLNNPDINTNGDTQISFTEASNYTGGLEIPGVSNLTGLEAFTNITLLNCSSSPKIISLDVSNNLALISLNCSGISVYSIDVSKNLDLKTLDCSNSVGSVTDFERLTVLAINEGLESLTCNNNFSLVDVGLSTNTTLKYLNCHHTFLQTLDIANKSNLNWLDCSETLIQELDFSNNNALTTLNIESTLIAELDVSNKEFLETFEASSTPTEIEGIPFLPLSSLNVSGCISLQRIDHLLGDQLTTLNCSNTGITSLDVTNSTSLNELFCSNNESLTSLNIANGNNTNLTLNVTNNPNLECIQVDDPDYSSENLSEYVDQTVGFSTDCSMSTIICRDYVNIPDTIFKEYLVNNTLINTDGDTEINCTEASSFDGEINIRSSEVKDVTGLEAFTSLTSLNCSYNNIETLDVSNNTALQNLYCNNNHLKKIDVSNNTALQILDCSTNDRSFNDPFFSGIETLNVTGCTALKTLECYRNNIINLDLTSCISLEYLDCSSNILQTLELINNVALQELYCFNNNLETLDVSKNSVLFGFYAGSNNLISVNLANGNNLNFAPGYDNRYEIGDNPDLFGNTGLSCIQVDDAEYSSENWINILGYNEDDSRILTNYTENCYEEVLSIIDNTFSQEINVYPNPVKDILSITSSTLIEKVELFNIQGQKIYKTNVEEIDFINFSEGLYILKLYGTDGKVGYKQILK